MSVRDERVCISQFGTAHFPFTGGGPVDADWWEHRWDSPKVVYSVRSSDSFALVINRGAAALGLSIDPSVFSYVPGPSNVTDAARHLAGIDLYGAEGSYRRFDVLDDGGRLWWSRSFDSISLSQVQISAGAGLTEGDPTHLGLRPHPPAGSLDFAEIMQLSASMLFIADTVAHAHDIWDGISWLLELGQRTAQRLRRAAAVVEEHAQDLHGRGGDPGRIERLFSKPRSAVALAAFLDLSVAEVESLLLAWGYVEGTDGRWRLGHSGEATLCRIAMRLSAYDPLSLVGQTPHYEGLGNEDEERRQLLFQALTSAQEPENLQLPTSENFQGWSRPN